MALGETLLITNYGIPRTNFQLIKSVLVDIRNLFPKFNSLYYLKNIERYYAVFCKTLPSIPSQRVTPQYLLGEPLGKYQKIIYYIIIYIYIYILYI